MKAGGHTNIPTLTASPFAYYPVSFHEQECFQYLGYKKGDFPESEKAESSTLAIPIYPELTDEMKAYVVDSIKEFYK